MLIRRNAFRWIKILLLSSMVLLGQQGCGSTDDDIELVNNGTYIGGFPVVTAGVPGDTTDSLGHGGSRNNNAPYSTPVIESVRPARMHIDGGVEVILTGKGFVLTADEATIVMLGDMEIRNFKVKSQGTELSFIAPAVDRPQTIKIKVSNGYADDSHQFVYFSGEMTLDEIYPSSGPVFSDTNITLTGTNFTYNKDTSVTIALAPGKPPPITPLLNVIVVSEEIITATIPPGVSTGVVPITVSSSNAEMPLTIEFTYN